MSEIRTETRQPDPTPDGPLTSDQVIPTAIMFFVAMLGGFVAFYRKWKDGNVRAFNFTELLGEMFVSGICGIFAYWVLNGVGANQWITAAGVGVVGHMGSRAMFMAEKAIHAWMDRWTGEERRNDIERRDGERREP